jgi:predicted permease
MEPVSGLSTFISSITTALADFSTTNLGTILVAALGITVGLVIAWFAYRFITKRVSKAMRKGSL